MYYFYIYILSYRNFRIRYLIKYFNPTFLVTLIFVVNSFINSGCLFYPVKKTCLTNDQVSWSVNYEKVKKEKKIVEKWAKGFYHQKNEIINDYEEYSDNFKWFKNWFKSHFLIKIIEPLILFIFICFICFNLNNYKLNFTKEIKNRKFLLLSLASIIFWLSQIPQFRFGFIYIFLFIFLFILNYFEKKSLIKDKIIYFIFLSVIFYNFANFNRIYKDFILNKSSVFPFYQIKNYSVKKKNYYKEVYYKIIRNDEAKISLSQNDKNLNNYENILFEEDQVKIKKIGKIKIISYFPQ